MKTKRKYLIQGQLLGTLRQQSALSLKQLEHSTGIDATRLYRLEGCTHRLTVDECIKLEEIYGTDIYKHIKTVQAINNIVINDNTGA